MNAKQIRTQIIFRADGSLWCCHDGEEVEVHLHAMEALKLSHDLIGFTLARQEYAAATLDDQNVAMAVPTMQMVVSNKEMGQAIEFAVDVFRAADMAENLLSFYATHSRQAEASVRQEQQLQSSPDGASIQ